MNHVPDNTLHALAQQAGLQIEWNDTAGRAMHVSDDVLRTVLGCLGLPAATAAEVADSHAHLQAEADDLTVPGLITGVVGQPIVLETAPRQLAVLAGQPYRVDYENGGGTVEGTVGADRAALQLAPIPTAGYHRLRIDTGAGSSIDATLAIAPPRCYAVADALTARGRAPDARLWGSSAQLYGLRAPGALASLSAGLGSYANAGTLARSLAQHGADALALSPVHAMFSADPHRYSPYSPSSRLFLNAMMIDPAALFGEHAVRQAVADYSLGDIHARTEAATLIDWPASATARLTVLRALHQQMQQQVAAGDAPALRLHEDFQAFCTARGQSLLDHAHCEALDAHMREHDPQIWHWKQWPAAYQSPSDPAVHTFARDHADAVRFHLFLQWAAARQLAAAQRTAEDAGMAIGLIADLAIGTDSAGSHVWSRQQDVLIGVTVGAPPDLFNTQGQNWGLTTFSPRAMRSQGREGLRAFIEMLRAVMSTPGGVRIDHVLGLMRLWVIPDGAPALDGVYLRYPLQDLLRLIALESWRNRCIVIGEDLGTVPGWLRGQLAERGLLGMRILWFEREEEVPGQPFRPPQDWARTSVAMTSTHDLSTLAGWWVGNDLRWQGKLGLLPAGMDEAQAHVQRMADRHALVEAFAHHNHAIEQSGNPPPLHITALKLALERASTADSVDADVDADIALDATADDFTTAATAYTAAAPLPLTIVPMEDLLGLVEQPNLPSTVHTHPNWRRRQPGPADTVLDNPTVQTRLTALVRAGNNIA